MNIEEQDETNSDKNSVMKKEDVQKSPDENIDKDFPGFPHLPSKHDTINPESKEEKKSADVAGENEDNGSAGAFSSTEMVGSKGDE